VHRKQILTERRRQRERLRELLPDLHPVVEGGRGEEARAGSVGREELLVVGEDLREGGREGGRVGRREECVRIWQKGIIWIVHSSLVYQDQQKEENRSVNNTYLGVEQRGNHIFRSRVDAPLAVELELLGGEICRGKSSRGSDRERGTALEDGFLNLC